MITMILVSHGSMARGIYESLEMLIGEQENVEAISFLPEDGPDDLTAKIEPSLKAGLEKGEVIVLTDIPNGTPFNCVCRLMENYRFQHMTGMNLPMAIDLASQKDDDIPAAQLCADTVDISRDAIKDVTAWMIELGIIE